MATRTSRRLQVPAACAVWPAILFTREHLLQVKGAMRMGGEAGCKGTAEVWCGVAVFAHKAAII